mmetsp:Transcript_19828/g.43021  ORF Transcript_19828/g.43021 Transcript_19828/m.43021 type:complete len:226 (-) Transcript_19828:36-713(-)
MKYCTPKKNPSLRSLVFLVCDRTVGALIKGLNENIARKGIVLQLVTFVLVVETGSNLSLFHKTRNIENILFRQRRLEILFLQSSDVVFYNVSHVGELVFHSFNPLVSLALCLLVLLTEFIQLAFEVCTLFKVFLVGSVFALANLFHLFSKHFHDLLVLKFQGHFMLERFRQGKDSLWLSALFFHPVGIPFHGDGLAACTSHLDLSFPSLLSLDGLRIPQMAALLP